MSGVTWIATHFDVDVPTARAFCRLVQRFCQHPAPSHGTIASCLRRRRRGHSVPATIEEGLRRAERVLGSSLRALSARPRDNSRTQHDQPSRSKTCEHGEPGWRVCARCDPDGYRRAYGDWCSD